MNKAPMTAAGYRLLQDELKVLRTVERPAIIDAIARAREHGDLSENAEYHAARDRQSFVEGRIAELEGLIKRAQVIDVSQMSGNTVRFGATVRLADEETEKRVTYQIVGEMESDISAGKLSISSPLARALIGKKAKDSVEVESPRGTRYYEIVKIKFA
ncbi:MAG: transcription elongation factor GreA [Alphaproteobacteria bacterium]